ncbi:hypothetical protein Salat_2071000 [Sesamum alatum]|uniref:Uncharacterized protein n=1 Tax=Sesamum alatum TaxID=300844 RepID=A0AAE2CGI3_9LAMI|nr:hypothetical protein Salat_2071000 [Sesamum alatum]
MAISFTLLPEIFVCLFAALTVSNALIPSIDYRTPSACSGDHNSLACEVEEAKFKIARLESILEERIEEINAKIRHFGECEKKIEELTMEIDRLKTTLSSIEHDYSRANETLSALEEEVRLLWAASRKNNFEIHRLEHKALDAERRLKEISLQVGERTEIVSEQWIQIQQLEQALHMAEKRTSKIRKELWRRCPFVKFCTSLFADCLQMLKRILDPYVSGDGPVVGFCKSQALQTFEVARHYHHQLQGFIKHAMKSNELTAALAHEEVVFFVASALLSVEKAIRTNVLANAELKNYRAVLVCAYLDNDKDISNTKYYTTRVFPFPSFTARAKFDKNRKFPLIWFIYMILTYVKKVMRSDAANLFYSYIRKLGGS